MDEEQFAKLSDSLETMAALMIGYKNKLVANGEGFDPDMAEHMCQQFHEVMCANLIEVE